MKTKKIVNVGGRVLAGAAGAYLGYQNGGIGYAAAYGVIFQHFGGKAADVGQRGYEFGKEKIRNYYRSRKKEIKSL